MNTISAAALLGQGKVALFCGAGISLDPPAGLPDWHELRDATIAVVAGRDPVAAGYTARLTSVEMFSQPGKRGMTPELVASVLAETTPAYFESLRALQDGEPNANHAMVAALAAQGHLRHVITTNFDLFVERALERVGVPYRAYRGADEFLAFDPEDRGVVHLLKIHGCISEPHTVTATVEQEGAGLAPPIRAALERLLTTHWLLFWGYSGADLKIDLDYLGMVSAAEHARGFLWNCFRSSTFEETPHPLVLQLAGMYGDRAIVAAGLAPDAIAAILPAQRQPAAIPRVPEPAAAWREKKRARLLATLDEWASRHVDGTTACRAIGDLLNIDAARLEAIACYRRMGELARSRKLVEDEVKAATLTGAVFREIGQFVEAYEEIKNAELLARQAGTWSCLYGALIELGTLYSAWNRPSDALASWREAETLFLGAQADEGDSQASLPLDLREALARAYLRLGYTRNFLDHAEIVERVARATGDKRSLCRILNLRMVSQIEFGEWTDALATGEEWHALATVLGYRRDIGYALVNLAAARMMTSNEDQALADLEQARALAEQEPGDRLELAVHSTMALLQAKRGQTEDARRNLHLAITISRRMQADRETAIALSSYANLSAGTAMAIEDRLALFDEAMRLFERVGDAQRAAQVAESMGDLLADQPNSLPQAVACYRRAMANYRLRNVPTRSAILQEKLQRCASLAAGIPLPTLVELLEGAAASQPVRDLLLADARTRAGVGEATLQQLAVSLETEFGATAGMSVMLRLHSAATQATDDGQPRRAAEYHGGAYRIAIGIHDLQTAGAELNDLALLAAGEKAYLAAQQLYEQSLALARETGNRREEATCLFNLGRLAERQGLIDKALSVLADAARLAREENLPYELATVARHLGGIRRDRREYEDARHWFEEAEAIFREMGEIDDIIDVLIGLGKVYRELKVHARSVHARTEAARLLEAQGKPNAAASFFLLAGNTLLKELQRPQEARPLLERALALYEREGMRDQMAQAQGLLEACGDP